MAFLVRMLYIQNYITSAVPVNLNIIANNKLTYYGMGAVIATGMLSVIGYYVYQSKTC